MKFTDGQWLLRKGVSMYNPVEIRDFEINKDMVLISSFFACIQHIPETFSLGRFLLY